MRIATLVYGLEGLGGIAKHVLYLSRELVEMGHSVDVWAVEYDRETCYPDIAGDLNIRALRRPGPVPFATNSRVPGGRMSAYLRGLRQYDRDQRQLVEAMPDGYDVINPHGNGIHWAAARYRRLHNTPAVWLCNDFWPMTHQSSAASGLAGRATRRIRQGLVGGYDALDREAVGAMDGIVVLSERVRDQMAAHYGVCCDIVRPGVSRPEGHLSREEMRARLGLTDDTFVLLTLCMLMPRRRLEDAVEAVKLLAERGQDVHYVIAGSHTHSPDYVQAIRERVARLGLSARVTLTGEVDEGELGGYYMACDAFIWPADENQSWSLASMEAMLYRRPVLASSANGFAEVLTDGRHALLFPARTPEAIADRVSALKGDAALYARLADEAEALVRGQYSWRGNAEAMLRLFEVAIARHALPVIDGVV